MRGEPVVSQLYYYTVYGANQDLMTVSTTPYGTSVINIKMLDDKISEDLVSDQIKIRRPCSSCIHYTLILVLYHSWIFCQLHILMK